MASTPDTRSTSAPGESRNGHFANGVHNGMNGHRELGRFGSDEVDPYANAMGGGDHRGYDPGAYEGTNLHDRLMGDTDD